MPGRHVSSQLGAGTGRVARGLRRAVVQLASGVRAGGDQWRLSNAGQGLGGAPATGARSLLLLQSHLGCMFVAAAAAAAGPVVVHARQVRQVRLGQLG